MKDKRREKPGLPCDELCPDDGVDPRVFFRREVTRRDRARKDGQLCRQAFQAFSLVLEQYAAREWADGMYLAEVAPAPDASRLRLALAFTEPRSADEAERVLERIRRLAGPLRQELAATISRKKVPELVLGLVEQAGGDDRR